MKQVCYTAIRLLRAGESFVQATILIASGSTPRGTGSCMLVLPDGSISGSIGGGPLEGKIIKEALGVFRTRQAQVINTVLDGSESGVNSICGGTAAVLIDYISAEEPGNLTFFEALSALLNSNSRSRIITIPPIPNDPMTRRQCLIMQDGSLAGTDGFDSAIINALKERHSSLGVYSRLENREVYLHQVGTDGTAFIFGAGHCGEKLAHILHITGFRTVVIDDRADFANRDRFPDADEILVQEPMDTPLSNISFGDDSYIIIVTRGHTYDELILRGALKTSAAYIGMIGSRRKRETIYANILADGYGQSDIARVFSPIGIEIGADTAEEIAISIAAELIKTRAGKRNEKQH